MHCKKKRLRFSYYVHNPNDISINKDEDFIVMPSGHRCTSAIAVRNASLRKFSLPFDWNLYLYPGKIKKVLENNFENFLPDVIPQNEIIMNKYDIKLAHFNSNTQKGIEEYTRRLERVKKIFKDNKKVYFIYINEDYLYRESHREKEFNNKMFSEMIDLDCYLKINYPNINHTIIYFNFIEEKIPENSNILNVVLKSNIYAERPSYLEPFRKFCSQILCNLFETQLTETKSIDFEQ
jgi:hypothetical protein